MLSEGATTVFRLRWKFFALFNVLFFGCVFATVVVASVVFWPPPLNAGLQVDVPDVLAGWGGVGLFLFIFVSNLAVSSFVVVSLPGVVCFPLSAGFLLFRAVLWGLHLYSLSVVSFWAVLPTAVLEGEGYVFAAVAGTVAGVSWVKPAWLFPAGEGLLRVDAFKKGLGEVLRVYCFVGVLLLFAAVVETVAMLLAKS